MYVLQDAVEKQNVNVDKLQQKIDKLEKENSKLSKENKKLRIEKDKLIAEATDYKNLNKQLQLQVIDKFEEQACK